MLCGGTVLEEALDLSLDRIVWMNSIFEITILMFSWQERQKMTNLSRSLIAQLRAKSSAYRL
jgi:hypothetical protein